MGMLATTIPRLARLARHAGSDTIVVRYEDLVRDPVAVRRALSDFLDLDLLDHSRAAAEVVPDSHRTSSDPASSIGRWRNELTAEQIDACEAAFAPYMRHFDYERSGQARPPAEIAGRPTIRSWRRKVGSRSTRSSTTASRRPRMACGVRFWN